jgi:hypothetical protein
MSTNFRPQPDFFERLEQQRRRQQQEFQSQQRQQEAMERLRRREVEYDARTEEQNSSALANKQQARKPSPIIQVITWVWMGFWRLVGLAIALGIVAVIVWFVLDVLRG